LLSKSNFKILQKPAMNLGKIVSWSFFMSLALSLVGAIAGIVYLLMGRKRVA
jgi:hypothetical protein